LTISVNPKRYGSFLGNETNTRLSEDTETPIGCDFPKEATTSKSELLVCVIALKFIVSAIKNNELIFFMRTRLNYGNQRH